MLAGIYDGSPRTWAIFAQPLERVKIGTSGGFKGRLVPNVSALDWWHVIFLHVLPRYPCPAFRFIEDLHQCPQVDFSVLVELESAKQIDVLPIGGLKEKVLAALGGGIKTVLLPKENEEDVDEISQQVLKNVTLIQVEAMDEVLKQALVLPNPDAFFQSKGAESPPLVG